ncbi:MAG TPA: phosphotransferase [Pseudonocardiaceae bacterium]
MRSDEMHDIATALGRTAIEAQVLAGGFSHETSLLTLADGQVVVRLGGQDPVIETAVMAAARRDVPVARVLKVLPVLPTMVLDYIVGTPLDQVLADAGGAEARLGAEIGRTAAAISSTRFDQPGFFADAQLRVTPQSPWSEQLPGMVDGCMTTTPDERLDVATRSAWAALCATHAQALTAVDHQSRLVHADFNPKNILVTQVADAWRVEAVLDWEFSFSGCPYADAANMARFGADYPPGFLDGFRAAFADHQPAGLDLVPDWAYLGRVMDMFALSDLVTRSVGNPIADQAAQEIRRWVAEGVPDSP